MKQEIRERIEKIRKGEVPEGYKKTKVGIIPRDWDVVSINKVLKPVKKAVNVEPTIEYKEIGIRSHGKGIFHKKLVQGNKLGNKRVFWVEEKCFVVNIVFAWEQAVAITSEDEIGFIASHRFPMYKPKNDSIDLDYLLAFYKSPRGKFQLNLASPGGAGRNKTLGQEEFAQSLIPLPPIDEQQKISEILSTWKKVIDLKEKLIEEKKQFKRGLMQKLLTGEMRFPEFTDDWEELSFNSVFRNINAKKYQIPKTDYQTSGKIPIVDQGQQYIIAYTNQDDRKFRVGRGGVIVFGDHTRIIKFIDFDFVVGADGTQLLLSQDGINLKFAYYQLANKQIKNLGYSRHFKLIKEMKYLVPPHEEQQKIAEILSTWEKAIELKEKELNQLKEQKRGLMQLLLTGIIRVEVD